MENRSKTALVTGSARRIGKHIVQRLHQEGYNVVIHCYRSIAEAKMLAAVLNQKRPNSAKTVEGNILDPKALDEIGVQAIEAFGGLDLLVNNASTFYSNDNSRFDTAAWDDLIGTNLKAPYYLSCLLRPYLERTCGAIVNLVDIHADRPLKNHTIYCTAKAGLAMMIKSLACEFAPKIRVNGISPGTILWPESPLDDDEKASILSQIALQRAGSPSDIADAVVFLANAQYITGQIIAVDGGRSLLGANIA